MRWLNMWFAAFVAAIITVIIRLTVYVEDCNLMVVGMTFLFFFVMIGGSFIVLRRVFNRCRDDK